jgi:hypothetical protein
MTIPAMVALSFPDDLWTILLALGLLASLVTTVAMILGRTPSKRPSQHLDAQARMPAWVPVPSASSARERASASARIKAAAAVRERGLHLTDVREVHPVGYEPSDFDAADFEPAGYDPAGYDPAGYDPAGYDPAGQRDLLVDDHAVQQPAAVTLDEAQVIFTHAAEHEPNCVAEVISEWIRADLKNMARRPR